MTRAAVAAAVFAVAVAVVAAPAARSAAPPAPSLNGPIVFTRWHNSADRVFSVAADGGTPRLVVRAAWEFVPTVSPDGRTIAFEHCRDTQSFAPNCDIAVAPITGGKPRDLTPDAEGYAFDPQWSPVPGVFGFHVATGFSTGGSADNCCQNIVVRDATGSHVVASTQGFARWSWSPDGTSLVYTDAERAELWIASTTRTCPIDVWPCVAPGAERLTEGVDADWSPAGNRIVFMRGGDLYTIRPDGTGERPITRTRAAEHRPSWSPDGRRIAFLRVSPTGGGEHVYVVDANGGALHRVSLKPIDGVPSWSPDSRLLTWGGDHVYVADADGRSAARDLGRGRRPTWGRKRCSRVGTAGLDRLDGTDGADVLCGFGGRDAIVPRHGRDVAFGDAGDDTFRLRDGEADAVSCGGGRDAVYADTVDAVARDCEKVER